MLRIGDWVQVGSRFGAIQAWGIETGFSRRGGHPVTKTSRRKALASPMPMLLVWFDDRQGADEQIWWPLDACVPCPPPTGKMVAAAAEGKAE